MGIEFGKSLGKSLRIVTLISKLNPEAVNLTIHFLGEIKQENLCNSIFYINNEASIFVNNIDNFSLVYIFCV